MIKADLMSLMYLLCFDCDIAFPSPTLAKVGTTHERRKLGESTDDLDNLAPRCTENLKRPALNYPVKSQNTSALFCNQFCVLLRFQRSMAASSSERESTHRSPEPKHSFFQNGAFDLR